MSSFGLFLVLVPASAWGVFEIVVIGRSEWADQEKTAEDGGTHPSIKEQ